MGAAADCGDNAECADTNPGYTCSCGVAHTGPDTTNEAAICVDTAGCDGVDCGTGATCADVAAPGTGYTCSCGAGYVEADMPTASNWRHVQTGACVAKEGGDPGEMQDAAAGQACFADAACLGLLTSGQDACTTTVAGGVCGLTNKTAVATAATCASTDGGVFCIKMDPTGGDAHELCDATTCSFTAGVGDAAFGTACNANTKCKAAQSCTCSGTNTFDAKTTAVCNAMLAGDDDATVVCTNVDGCDGGSYPCVGGSGYPCSYLSAPPGGC
jgi:hypothetical protein